MLFWFHRNSWASEIPSSGLLSSMGPSGPLGLMSSMEILWDNVSRFVFQSLSPWEQTCLGFVSPCPAPPSISPGPPSPPSAAPSLLAPSVTADLGGAIRLQWLCSAGETRRDRKPISSFQSLPAPNRFEGFKGFVNPGNLFPPTPVFEAPHKNTSPRW